MSAQVVMHPAAEAKLVADINAVIDFLDRHPINTWPITAEEALGPVVQPDPLREVLRKIAKTRVPPTDRPTSSHWALKRVIGMAEDALARAEA